MRLHFLRQAVSDSEPAAILSMSVSALGQLQVHALGIEPEHAHLMLDKLDHLKNKLQAFIDQQQKTNTGSTAQVIDLRR